MALSILGFLLATPKTPWPSTAWKLTSSAGRSSMGDFHRVDQTAWKYCFGRSWRYHYHGDYETAKGLLEKRRNIYSSKPRLAGCCRDVS
ncbi:hypothetical protein HBH70_210800 [Parastagonospora nodorum]|nr:hypothetical protein HBH51_104790 [Parastagonospora nodorum]KAH4063885.1 hypothetical protein HBH50_187980 [Parastagonospora nodorum]KAH4079610.1 hypothetical protein HBH48_216240 [Parastagonospora nodorum]KAH4164748.1 hypothetical protein HBH43_144930 [Parastagonospora nodorum]KAH4850538.1 hypothetical protein HBH75_133380 [Parastagonospora nodorum]